MWIVGFLLLKDGYFARGVAVATGFAARVVVPPFSFLSFYKKTIVY